MYDLTAMGELLIDFTQLSTDGEGYPTPVSYTHLTLPTIA